MITYGGPYWTVPELLFERQELIAAAICLVVEVITAARAREQEGFSKPLYQFLHLGIKD
jgi:hypothetical protein